MINVVFTLRAKHVFDTVVPKVKVDTKLVRMDEMRLSQWRQLKELQGFFSVRYLKFRYGSRNTYILLAYVEKKLVHVQWIVPAKRINRRYPFVTEDSYCIISCLTSQEFRGLGIYPSKIQHVVRSNILAKSFWIWTACTNIASLKGITKAGGIKVGEFRQRKWFWGGISRIRYFSIESNNK